MACVAFGGALRGEESAFARLQESLLVHTGAGINHSRRPHLTVCLDGKFKTEKGRKKHFLALTIMSKLGIKYAHWFSRLLFMYMEDGITEGPLFRSKVKNKRASSISVLDKLWLPYLREAIPLVHTGILPQDVCVDVFWSDGHLEEVQLRRPKM
mmetsp:Transcript_17848/g.27060  ORF Transcript_17848/g.27060 Transcript_17848/m.27060 type:complete len:154 (+) Transcript_17848:963-1424(+)